MPLYKPTVISGRLEYRRSDILYALKKSNFRSRLYPKKLSIRKSAERPFLIIFSSYDICLGRKSCFNICVWQVVSFRPQSGDELFLSKILDPGYFLRTDIHQHKKFRVMQIKTYLILINFIPQLFCLCRGIFRKNYAAENLLSSLFFGC